jgi:two-component system NarL family response regulator
VPASQDISVLVIDDHAVFADALRERLSREPDLKPVTVAYDLAEASVQVARARPAVAVLDLFLGNDSGLEVAELIREVSPGTQVIVLTANESGAEMVTGLARGVRAWLPKTVDVEHLVRVIRGVHAGEAWLAPRLLGRVLGDLVQRSKAPEPDAFVGLTRRERDVLHCMVDGLSRAETAERLHMSLNTVRTHTQHLSAKLGAHSTLELVALARRNGLQASND